MILLWGTPGDGPFDAVRVALQRIGSPHRVINQCHSMHASSEFAVTGNGVFTGRVIDPDGEVDLASIGAAYIRPSETARACNLQPSADRAYLRAVAMDAGMIVWADLADAAMVNRPSAMAANNSKPYQLAWIARCGFSVPATLVTTDTAAVRRFAARHGRIIYKSVSGVRSIVAQLGEAGDEVLTDVANCPTQFQEYVAGSDVRVHVVGDTIYSTEIRSTADDYRYASRVDADLAMTPLQLPDEIADRCRAMARGMALQFAGIDLRRTPDGRWVCLEVNPSPGFTFFEAATGQPIAAAVADLLIKLDGAHRSRELHRGDASVRRQSRNALVLQDCC
jgi:glutathione synthase/RimK-type ligase-like ATP-grasp enzyme